MTTGQTRARRVLGAIAGVIVLAGGLTAVAQAATSSSDPAAVSCPGAVSEDPSSYTVTSSCTFPKPAPVTVTATSTSTVTATATATVTVTASPSSTPSSSTTPTPTPTPTPTSTPTQPPPTGFPNAANTGVPAGTALAAQAGCNITTAGITFDAKTFSCPNGLDIKAANVTITRSKVNGPIDIDTDTNRTWSLTLTDSEVDAGKLDLSALGNGNMTVLRANIHGGHNGIQCEEHASICSMTDSWIHGQYLSAQGAQHLGGMADFGHVVPCTGPDAGGVKACVNLVHNTILCEPLPNAQDGGCSGDINLFSQLGPLHGAIVKDNLIGANIGNAYCTYGGTSNSDHVIYTGNVFQRGSNGKCANYGPVTSFDSSRPGNVWSGNVWSDGGAVSPEN